MNWTNLFPKGTAKKMRDDCTSSGRAPAVLGRFAIILGGTVKDDELKGARQAKAPDTFVNTSLEAPKISAA